MNGTTIIFKKELKRVFSDKKLIFSLFILPAIVMIALYGLMGFMMGAMNDDIVEHKNVVYVVNADDVLKNTIKIYDISGLPHDITIETILNSLNSVDNP